MLPSPSEWGVPFPERKLEMAAQTSSGSRQKYCPLASGAA